MAGRRFSRGAEGFTASRSEFAEPAAPPIGT